MTTAASSGPSRAFRRCRTTSSYCTPRSAQTRSRTEIATPTRVESVRRPPPAAATGSGLGKRERDEVEKLLQERLDGREAAIPGQLVRELLADHSGALQRRPAAVADHADLDGDGLAGSRRGRGGEGPS